MGLACSFIFFQVSFPNSETEISVNFPRAGVTGEPIARSKDKRMEIKGWTDGSTVEFHGLIVSQL